jgi:ABC-2 type transport system ATP-binding protein
MESVNATQAAIECVSLEYLYGRHAVLHNTHLSVANGEIVGLVGSNGAGKTTLFDILSGLKKHHSGQLFITDRNALAYLSQVITLPHVFLFDEVRELIAGLYGATMPISTLVNYMNAAQAERFVRLSKKKVGNCSYGEQRWFMAVLVLALPARIFVLDEPTASVDPEYRYYIWQAILRRRNQSSAIIVSTHMLSEAAEYCDRFYFLRNGFATEFDSVNTLMRITQTSNLDEAFIKFSQERKI